MCIPRRICRRRRAACMGTTWSTTQKVNEELGGDEAHKDFAGELGEIGLGQVLDIVPEPHGDRAEEPVLVGCAGERAIEQICDVVRY